MDLNGRAVIVRDVNRRSSSKSLDTAAESLHRAGERFADQLGVPVTSLRHVVVTYHNGRHWTCDVHWEQLVDGAWLRCRWLGHRDMELGRGVRRGEEGEPT